MSKLIGTPNSRKVAVMRHLQQLKPVGAKANEWGPQWPLNRDIAEPQAARICTAYTGDVQFAFAGHSELYRTEETLGMVVGSRATVIKSLLGISPPDYKNANGTWDCFEKLKTETAAEIFHLGPELFEQCGNQMMATVMQVAKDELKDGEVAILVTHNPMCESLLAQHLGGVDKLPVPNFGKGDMVVFTIEDDKIVDFAFLPVPAEVVAEKVAA